MMTTDQVKIVASARAKIKDGKERIKRLRDLDAGSGGSFWQAQKGELEAAIKGLEGKRDYILYSRERTIDPDRDLITLNKIGSEILSLKGVIANVESAREKVDTINLEIAKLTEQISELESGKTPRKAQEAIV